MKLTAFNKEHNIIPQKIKKEVYEVIEATTELSRSEKGKTAKKNEQKLIDKERAIAELTVDMKKAAELLQFELAAQIRDEIRRMQEE